MLVIINLFAKSAIYYLYLYREHEQFIDAQILWEKQPNGYENLREILRQHVGIFKVMPR
ncbi:MAG: hypothetical protein ACTSO2_14225 [Promethearchaeota archaeon]